MAIQLSLAFSTTDPAAHSPTDGGPLSLEAVHAARLARRLVVDGPLGAGRTRMLGWLVEAADRQRQDANAAQVRAAPLIKRCRVNPIA